MKTKLFPLIAAALLAGCAAPRVARDNQFNAGDFARYQGSGTATIRGQAFLKTRSGDVKPGAGNTVNLTPSTPYTDEWYRKTVLGGQIMQGGADISVVGKYMKTTIADAGGNFEFHNLPAGKYYLTCAILWEYGTRNPISGFGVAVPTGGIAHGTVTLSEGELAKVIVTR